MLNRNWFSLLNDIEHDKYYCFGTIILTVVNGAYHFNNGFTLMNHLDIAIDVNDGEFALLKVAKVYHVMMVPSKFLTWRKLIPHRYYLSILLRKTGKVGAIPSLRSAQQFSGFYVSHIILWFLMRKFTMIFCKHTKRVDFIVDSFHKKNIILLMLLLFSLLDSFYNISQIFVGYLALLP